MLTAQGQRFNSVKEAVGSGQWPNVKKVKSKKGKVVPEKSTKQESKKVKVIPEKSTKQDLKKGKVIHEKSSKLASKLPQTKFMRAKDLLRGLLRKNHAARKDFGNLEKLEEEAQPESTVVSWVVKCDDCDYKAENITALKAHKKAKHMLIGEE